MTAPETRYAKSGDIRIAYQVVGHGPIDLVFVQGYLSNLDVHWEDPGFTHLLNRLSAFTRLILFDKRGTGLSDRVDVHALPSLETRMDDVRAVMDAAGSGRAVLLGASEGGPMSILFAATYPQRTRALVLYGAYAHFHTWVMSREALEAFISEAEATWGSGASLVRFAPERLNDPRFVNWWSRFERLSASPSAGIALARMNAAIDVRHVLGSIRVPTLVIHRTDDVRIKFAGGRYLAEKIPAARLSALPGRDHVIWSGDIDRVVDEIEEFITGARPVPAHDRVLATLMVSRLVAPQRLAATLGDRAFRGRIARLRDLATEAITRHGGQPVGVGVEEIGARFDGPARAVRCALALREAAEPLSLALAAGVHTGEVEIGDGTVTGLALHVAGRLSALATAGEVLVSGMVNDLVAGSGLQFDARSEEMIDGLEGPLRVLRAVDERGERALSRRPAVSAPRLESLTAREREVLGLIAEGLSNGLIAARLRLSEHTVKRHVANILLKLDMPTRAAAAAFAGRRKP